MIYYNYFKKPSSLEGFSSENIKNLLSDEEFEVFKNLSDLRKIEKLAVKKGVSRIVSQVFKDQVSSYKIEKRLSKPYLKKTDDSKTYFLSYSHSKDSILVALSKSLDIGVDIESEKRFKEHKAFSKWVHPLEFKCISLDNDLVKKAIIWTRKESLAKLTGLGYKLTFKEHQVYPEDKIRLLNQDVHFHSMQKESEILSFSCFSVKPVNLTEIK